MADPNDKIVFEMTAEEVQAAMNALLNTLFTQKLSPEKSIYVLDATMRFLSNKYGIDIKVVDPQEECKDIH